MTNPDLALRKHTRKLDSLPIQCGHAAGPGQLWEWSVTPAEALGMCVRKVVQEAWERGELKHRSHSLQLAD